MPDHSVHRAGELAPDERLLVERWLGRPISNDETISVNAYRPHAAPTGNEREMLWQEIMTQAREIGSRAQDANEDEIDALIDEAFAAVRAVGVVETYARLQHSCSSIGKPSGNGIPSARHHSPRSHSRSVAVHS